MQNSTQRFFKLLYVLALVAIVLALPILIVSWVKFDQITITSYKAKCVSNGKDVVLEGDSQAYVFTELTLNNPDLGTKKTLNFYCKYYDRVQPYLTAYLRAANRSEEISANENFFKFQDSVISNVGVYPTLYQLEVVEEVTDFFPVYSAIVGWLIFGTLAFAALQILRMFYSYIAFGEIVWHPFRQRKLND